MVLVAIKNLFTGGPSAKSPLLDGRYESYSATENDAASSSSLSTLSFEGVQNPRVISDVIIGLSDGLTVPFALTAGLSSLGSSKLVITGGMAELVSGAISMGLGGYLAAKSESEYYETMLLKEKNAHQEDPEAFEDGVRESLAEYHLSEETIKMVVNDLNQNTRNVANFMVKMVRGVEEPAQGRELTSALTIGIAYFLGGFVPMIPYFFTDTVHMGLIISTIVMGFTLFLFGYIKTVLSLGSDCSQQQRFMNGISMFLTGGLAAGAAWALVRAIDT